MTTPAVAVPLHRNRDFAILWSGEAVSALGTSMSVLVFPLVGYAVTGSTVLAGLATTAVLLGSVIARLPAGALVDRWPRGRVLLLANLCGAAFYASLAIAALAGRLTLRHLVVVGFLSGVTEAFIDPAASAAVRTVVPAQQLPVAYSQLQARQHGADLIGPPLGGALFSVARGLPFLLDAVSYAVCATSILFLRNPLPAPGAGKAREPLVADLTEGLRFVWHNTVIRAVMIWAALINVSVTLVLVTITLRLIRASVHPAAIGLVDAIAAGAGLLGALIAPMVITRMRTGVTAIATGLILGLIVLPMAWTTNVVIIGALLGAGCFLLPANNSGISAYFVAVTPDRLQGRVNAAVGFVATGIQPVAPILAGVLVSTIGGQAATLTGATVVAVSVLPLLTSTAIRQLGRPASWPIHNTDPA